MNVTIIITIWNQLSSYVNELDWTYIITFIIIAYGCNHHKVKGGIKKITCISSKTKYRVAIIGLLYGIAIYFIRGYQLNQIECLFQSFVFALVFHKLILEGLTTYIGKKLRINSVIEKEASTRGYYDRFHDMP
mgnify:CR=1 FL=1|tara:strand:- start:31894 stop:32292 length:399 start_codon:yes stop_codon:yes gene_type:complete